MKNNVFELIHLKESATRDSYLVLRRGKEQEEGYYKNLLYSLKQKLDAKDDLPEMNNLRRRIAKVKFLLSQEQCKVAKSEKEVYDARKVIGMYRMIVALLFACLVICVLKLGVIVLS
uniref:Uncharacterized protein n=1 Tax=Lactuca sativa TaxID=4236 RepID=A0A9R1VIC4_LACSA|nr:hypothetical protein LSAT_V11C500266530 [Lactuca sativa]